MLNKSAGYIIQARIKAPRVKYLRPGVISLAFRARRLNDYFSSGIGVFFE